MCSRGRAGSAPNFGFSRAGRRRFSERPNSQYKWFDCGETGHVKLIVGLGNPGRKYAGTRHNVGFAVLAELGRRHGAERPKSSFQGEVVEIGIANQRVLLLAPHTLMNRSGRSVVEARDFYKLSDDDLLVMCDDFHLDRGRLRLRSQGSAGGQNGLKDIIRALGTDQFPRLRLGIGSPPTGWDSADYVLGRFSASELPDMELAVVRAAEAAEDWVRLGTQASMNRYNAKPSGEE